MSSEYTHERLETLQINYRRAWTSYAASVELLQTAKANGEAEDVLSVARQNVEQGATDYRAARDEMALFLLDQLALSPEYPAESEMEPELAVCRTA